MNSFSAVRNEIVHLNSEIFFPEKKINLHIELGLYGETYAIDR